MKKRITVLYWQEIKPNERTMTNRQWERLVMQTLYNRGKMNPHSFKREKDRLYVPVWLRGDKRGSV